MKPDTRVADRGESVALMEPLVVGEGSPHRTGLTDLAVELAGKAAGFRRSLPEGVLAALADLVRAMNCYYSNLIEGHDTHPVDIERALRDDYSADVGKRNLQLEARAHIAVQAWIDRGGLGSRAATLDGLVETHRRFCEALPEDLLRAEDPATGESAAVIPGALRERDVKVGHHVPVSPGALPRFLEALRNGVHRAGQDGQHSGRRRRPPSPSLDSPVPGRQRPRCAVDVPRDAAGEPGYRRRLVHRARSCPQRRHLQGPAHGLRCDAAQRPRRTRSPERRGAGRVHALLPDHVHRSGRLHGRARAAGPSAPPHPDLGRGGDQGRRPAAEIRRRSPGHPLSRRASPR